MKKFLSWIYFVALVAFSTFSVSAGAINQGIGARPEILAQQATLRPSIDYRKAFIPQDVRRHGNLNSPFAVASHRVSKYVNEQMPMRVAAYNSGELPELRGNLRYSLSWTSEETAKPGFYKIPTSPEQEFELITQETKDFNYGGVVKDGVYYSTYIMPFMGGAYLVEILGIDVTTGDVLYRNQPFEDMIVDFRVIPVSQTYDPVTGQIYSICFTEDGSFHTLCTMEYTENGPVSDVIATFGDEYRWCAIACDAEGQLWGIVKTEYFSEDSSPEVTASFLVKVDKNTGEFQVIGETGKLPQNTSDATIDLATGRMFWAISALDWSGSLCEVNLSTGAATTIYTFPGEEEVSGLIVAPAPAEDKAPAAVSALTVNYPEGALTGTVDFTSPVTLFDGTNATGDLTYHVLVNGEEVATGESAYGAAEKVPYVFEYAGEYTVDVYVSNEVGNGPKSRVKAFIGKGIPTAPQNASLTWADGKMTITWDAVTSSSDGGYVNPAEVTYTVTRVSPTESVVVTDTKELSASESLVIQDSDDFALYSYEVVAKYDSQTSAPAMTNAIPLGSIKAPYTNNFDSEADIQGYTVIDSNNDGITWAFNTDAVYVSYNSSMAMDDWFITPGIYLEVGKAYTFSFKVKRQDISFPEIMEVFYGKANTVEAMTQTLLERTTIENTEYSKYEYTIIPDQDDVYFFGFHGCSDSYMYYLWLDDISISEGSSVLSPDVVDDLVAVSDPNGELKVTLNFKAPQKAIDGTAISEISKIEIYRDDSADVLSVFENPTPGQSLSYVDQHSTLGTYTYTVVAYNAAGKGKNANVSVFAGIDFPAQPQNVKIAETETPGEVSLSWDAVTTDRNGNPIAPSVVSYSVYEVDGEYAGALVASEITTTSYTFQAVTEGQVFAQYVVFAVTQSGEGEGTLSEMVPVGLPYTTLAESFTDGMLSYAWGMDNYGWGEWMLYSSGDGDIEAQDNDSGFAVMYGEYSGDFGDLYSGKITIGDMVSPTLSFYRFVMGADDSNLMDVFVREIGGEYVSIYSKTCNEISTERGWHKSTVSLDAYKGKTIQIMFRGTTEEYRYSFLDNIKIGSLVDYDLSISKIDAPEKATTGREYTVTVTVSNNGLLEATGAKVEVYANDALVATKDVETLAPDANASIVFTFDMAALSEESVKYYAVVTFEKDQNPVNNTSDVVSVEPVASKLPSVNTLTGKMDNGAATLSWDAPELTVAATVETFENAESWAHQYDGWTFVDVDGMPLGSFGEPQLPGITGGETLASFFVMDVADSQFSDKFAAHSGTKYLASMFMDTYSQIDDWAISPELSGDAQTISFYAKSYDESYPETMELYYSDGSLLPADFTLVKSVDKVAGSWTLYSFDVPAGAKHFAIRSCASDNYMLMIDDVTYMSSEANAVLLGYNVYRDGKKINSELVTTGSYVDNDVVDGDHVYQVTVLYDKGESVGSNKVPLSSDGIHDVTTGVSINAAEGLILVNGADGLAVAVCSVDGKVVYAGVGQDVMAISVEQGLYLVSVGETTAKLMVK